SNRINLDISAACPKTPTRLTSARASRAFRAEAAASSTLSPERNLKNEAVWNKFKEKIDDALGHCAGCRLRRCDLVPARNEQRRPRQRPSARRACCNSIRGYHLVRSAFPHLAGE